MRHRRSSTLIALALLCSPVPALADGRTQWDLYDGTRCSVSHSKRTELTVDASQSDGGYNEGTSISFGLRVPLGAAPSGPSAHACNAAGVRDQQRSEFRFLKELYEEGLLSADTFRTKAKEMGIDLQLQTTTEPSTNAIIIGKQS